MLQLNTSTLRELQILELVLTGGSIIDVPRFPGQTREDDKALLHTNGFEPENPIHRKRIHYLLKESVHYLELNFGIRLDPQFKRIQDPFVLFETTRGNSRKKAEQACMLLKTMNIINHIDGREWLIDAPLTHRELFHMAEKNILIFLKTLKKKRHGIADFEWGQKHKESLITKLLSRKETIAAQISDRLRFRIITSTPDDVTHVIQQLFTHTLPMNYVIPGASMNQLFSLAAIPQWKRLTSSLLSHLPPKRTRIFSGKDYRTCKFVVDVPVRLDVKNKLKIPAKTLIERGHLAFVMVEFQILDLKTHLQNNTGENNHLLYKKRQRQAVLKRLRGKT